MIIKLFLCLVASCVGFTFYSIAQSVESTYTGEAVLDQQHPEIFKVAIEKAATANDFSTLS